MHENFRGINFEGSVRMQLVLLYLILEHVCLGFFLGSQEGFSQLVIVIYKNIPLKKQTAINSTAK